MGSTTEITFNQVTCPLVWKASKLWILPDPTYNPHPSTVITTYPSHSARAIFNLGSIFELPSSLWVLPILTPSTRPATGDQYFSNPKLVPLERLALAVSTKAYAICQHDFGRLVPGQHGVKTQHYAQGAVDAIVGHRLPCSARKTPLPCFESLTPASFFG